MGETTRAAAWRRLLSAFGPAMARPSLREILRAAFGAGAALALCGAALTEAGALLPDSAGRLFLVAPLGASAFLMFALPNSPLAQPWSAMVGNTVSALTAIFVLKLGLPFNVTAGAAVGGAMGAMAALRAMHPPGAAIALVTVLNGAAVGRLGYGYAFAPVLLDTMILTLLAIAWTRATGRKYPFRQPAQPNRHGAADPAPERRLGLTAEDLERLLGEFNQSANIGAEDFGRILAAAEAEAARRRFGGQTCADIMSRDVKSVRPEAPLESVAALFRRHRFKILPVTDAAGDLVGLITQNDLIARGDDRGGGPFRKSPLRAADIMTPHPRAVPPGAPVGDLVRMLADGGVQAAPVTEGKRLVGFVTRSDLLALLARMEAARAL